MNNVRQLSVDWNALHGAFQMNMPEVKCFLNLETGKVLKVPPGDPRLGEVRQKGEHYAEVLAIPSRIQYQWLDNFIAAIEDEGIRARMEAAINGKGAFRRFKDILLTLPDERRRWFEFRDAEMRKRICDWVREHGVEPTNEPDWTAMHAEPDTADSAVESLRDFLIAWVDERDDSNVVTPMALEKLAHALGENFYIRARE